MMKLFRNPEILRPFLLCVALSAAASAAAFFLNAYLGLGVFVLCVLFTAIYCVSTYRRYRRIAELSFDVDRVLHGDSHISFEKYAEGELGVLQSELYKMTVRLREQQQRLQADKAYLADSIADISHQIRTPLTSINLLISLLSEPNITDQRRQELARDLYELLSRIDWLVTSLLKISRLDAGTVTFKKETLPLEQLVHKAAAPLLIPLELREQTLGIRAEGNFCGDVLWTCEALTNIIKNCIEHTPNGGRIEIDASENALYAEISVSDNGSGISSEDLPHIFERFYKGANSGEKSFGIGLALSARIVAAQQGAIKAEQNTPKGARFVMRFYKGSV